VRIEVGTRLAKPRQVSDDCEASMPATVPKSKSRTGFSCPCFINVMYEAIASSSDPSVVLDWDRPLEIARNSACVNS
jgi:hypothetical protein